MQHLNKRRLCQTPVLRVPPVPGRREGRGQQWLPWRAREGKSALVPLCRFPQADGGNVRDGRSRGLQDAILGAGHRPFQDHSEVRPQVLREGSYQSCHHLAAAGPPVVLPHVAECSPKVFRSISSNPQNLHIQKRKGFTVQFSDFDAMNSYNR